MHGVRATLRPRTPEAVQSPYMTATGNAVVSSCTDMLASLG